MDISTVLIILLFLFGIFIAYLMGYKSGKFRRDKHWEAEIPIHRKDAVLKSRAVLSGQFSEQLAPFLPNFGFSPTECRFIGKPIDFIVFKGMDNKEIEEIVFVEIKSGNAKLSSSEKKLKDAVKKRKVKWNEYRVPRGLTDIEDAEED